MKKTMLVLLLGLSVLILAACGASQEEHFDVASGVSDYQPAVSEEPPAGTQVITITADYDFDDGTYDPASEEAFSDFDEPDVPAETPIPQAPTSTPVIINSQYAGATPLVIDPIDKPTPSPAPTLTYAKESFATYDATRLRISFEAPAGWTVDDTIADTYLITNPDKRMAYPAQLMVSARAVSTTYSGNDMAREAKAVSNTIKGEYDHYNPTNTADRTLFDAKGKYMDFDGYIKGTDIRVWGRIHVVYVNKTLVVVRITVPYEYKSLYKDTVYRHFRETLKFTR